MAKTAMKLKQQRPAKFSSRESVDVHMRTLENTESAEFASAS